MSYEVLVVDDNLPAAREFARLVTLKAKIKAIETDDPDQAIEIVRAHPIKVTLLDQRMPKKNGTELFLELKQVDSLLKGMMLTGEADVEETGEAIRIGFSDYIHKSEIESIVPRVLVHYRAYHTDLAERAERDDASRTPFYSYRRGLPWFGYAVNFYLIDVEVIDEDYIFADSWRTIVTVDAGETKKYSVNLQRATSFIVESEEKTKLLGNASFKLPLIEGLTTKLEEAVEERFKTTATSTETRTVAIEREFRLPEEPEYPEKIHVKSRQYEQAVMYRKLRIIIRKSCDCCESEEVIATIAFQSTEKTATRQHDYLSDGTSRVTETGVTGRVLSAPWVA